MEDMTDLTTRQTEADFTDWKKKTAIFISSQSFSLFGSMLVQYAIIWHITLSTQSGAVLTIATIAGFLPQILISLFAGVWADRYPRKLLIIGADALTATSTLLLAVLFLLGYQQLWLLFVISAIRSIGAGIQTPAVSALLPQIVPTDKLLKVNSLNGTLQPFIMIGAPVAAGALLSYASIEAIFFVDVSTAAVAIGLLLALHIPPHLKAATQSNTGYFDDLRAGLTYIREHQTITTLFKFFAFVWFLVTPVAFLTPLLVARAYGEEVWRLTANEITFFAGSIIGGFMMMSWSGFKNHFRTIGMSCVIWAVLFTGLGLTHNFIFYLVLMFLSGIPMPFMGVSTTTLLQEIVDADYQGRVFGVQNLIVNTIMPLGMMVFGPLADVTSIELLLVITSALMAVPGLWIFFNKRLHTLHPPQPVIPMLEKQPGD